MQKSVGSPKEEKIGDDKERCVISYYTFKHGNKKSGKDSFLKIIPVILQS